MKPKNTTKYNLIPDEELLTPAEEAMDTMLQEFTAAWGTFKAKYTEWKETYNAIGSRDESVWEAVTDAIATMMSKRI